MRRKIGHEIKTQVMEDNSTKVARTVSSLSYVRGVPKKVETYNRIWMDMLRDQFLGPSGPKQTKMP